MIYHYYQYDKNGIIIHLKITANASKNDICGIINDTNGQQYLKVKVTAIADNGAANKAIIEFLAKKWDISKSSIEIIAGKTASRKRILIKDTSFKLTII